MIRKALPFVVSICAVLSQAHTSVDITLIANSGFLISGDSKRVLVDGMFTEGYNYFPTPPDSVLEFERNATPPFDKVNAVIVSHSNADHFDAGIVVEHLSNNGNAVLLTTADVVDSMKKSDSYSKFADRTVPGIDSSRSRIDTTIACIRFNAFELRHDTIVNPNGPPNMGCVFSIDGMKLFHPGDGLSHDVSAYQKLNLADERIDIAFLPFWFFDGTSGGTAQKIINYLRPKAIILMHAAKGQDSIYRTLARNNSTDSMHVYYMEPLMKTLRFRKNCVIDTVSDAVSLIAPISPSPISKRLRAASIIVVAGNNGNHFSISREFLNSDASVVDVIDHRGRTVMAAVLGKCRRNDKFIIDTKNIPSGLYVLRFRK